MFKAAPEEDRNRLLCERGETRADVRDLLYLIMLLSSSWMVTKQLELCFRKGNFVFVADFV